MEFNLSPQEIRVLGSLMEKSVVTPDQYPLTLNALTNACNQKSSRNPVMNLDKGEVQSIARELKARHLVRVEENFKNGVEKYTQVFCNTHLGDTQFDPQQFAIISLLMLRGAQTPGEIRSRSVRLHEFADNAGVVRALDTLMEQERQPWVVKLPRQSGRKDSEYMHLLSGPIDIASYEHSVEQKSAASEVKRSNQSDLITELTNRVDKLEAEVSALKAML